MCWLANGSYDAMKTAAVIGANSMLGSQLVSFLSSMGVEVISIGRFAEADIHLDLNKGFLSPLLENAHADVIFHCAASFADDSCEGIRRNFQTNTASCLWVLELAEHLGCNAIVYAGLFPHWKHWILGTSLLTVLPRPKPKLYLPGV